MKISILLVILTVVSGQRETSAEDFIPQNVYEIHKNVTGSYAYSFTEDVFSILPPDMKAFLNSDYKLLEQSSRINNRYDYWINCPVSKDKLLSIANNTKPSSPAHFAKELGLMVELIFEVAMSDNNDDPLFTNLQKNIKMIRTNFNELDFRINYEGYSYQSIETVVGYIYELNKYKDKGNIYPKMVALTADLWSAIWASSGNKPILQAKTIIRTPGTLNICSTVNNTSLAKPISMPIKIGPKQTRSDADIVDARKQRLRNIYENNERRNRETDKMRFNSWGNLR